MKLIREDNDEIIRRMAAIFQLEDMEPRQAEDFLEDRFGVLPKIRGLEHQVFTIYRAGGGDTGGLERLHRQLMIFAHSVLREKPDRYPCATMIAGYIANRQCDAETTALLDSFCTELKKKFDRYQPSEELAVAQCMAYYNGACLAALESNGSRRLHTGANFHLQQLWESYPNEYIEFVAAAMKAASRGDKDDYPSCEKLLLANLETRMRVNHALITQSGHSNEDVLPRIKNMAVMAGALALNCAAGSQMEKPLLNWFKVFWSFWDTLDSAGAQTQLKEFRHLSKSHPASNRGFAVILDRAMGHLERTGTLLPVVLETPRKPNKNVGLPRPVPRHFH